MCPTEDVARSQSPWINTEEFCSQNVDLQRITAVFQSVAFKFVQDIETMCFHHTASLYDRASLPEKENT